MKDKNNPLSLAEKTKDTGWSKLWDKLIMNKYKIDKVTYISGEGNAISWSGVEQFKLGNLKNFRWLKR